MISSFSGPNRFLSNFWPAVVELDGLQYPTVEHGYQAAKTNQISQRILIRECKFPAQAKRLGSRVILRHDWNEVKLSVMANLVHQKFTLHPDLSTLLLATGDQELIEGNTWGDRFWGVCGGRGENHLGKILMGVRMELHNGE